MYGISECLFKHCYLCGTHHGHSGLYCLICIETRYAEIEKDAKIRAITSDNADHRLWVAGHPDAVTGLDC